jgi:hypothetical protein
MAKTQRVPIGRYLEHVDPAKADRMSWRDVGPFHDQWRELKVWPSRGAMLAACRMMDKGMNSSPLRWHPVVGEQY